MSSSILIVFVGSIFSFAFLRFIVVPLKIEERKINKLKKQHL